MGISYQHLEPIARNTSFLSAIIQHAKVFILLMLLQVQLHP